MTDLLLSRADPTDLDTLRQSLRKADPGHLLCDIQMKDIIIQEHAVERLPEIIRSLTNGKNILMVTDATDIRRGSNSLKPEVYSLISRNFETQRLVLTEEGDIHATDTNSRLIQQRLRGIDCVVSVGSGTITDLCKNATYEVDENIPLICVQTALSVNAFSDGVSVMLINGVKRTVHARYPSVLVVDLDVVKQAPPEMNVSGYGDLIATWTAPADWYLSHTIGMNPNYHEAPADLIRYQCAQLLGHSKELAQGDAQTLDDLARVLTLSGLSMGIAGESSPCSGSEHIISHLIDMASPRRKTGICYHGTQVAVSAILASIVWDIFLKEFDPDTIDVDACYPSIETMAPKVTEAFAWLDDTGAAAAECLSDYEKKLAAWREKKNDFMRFLKQYEAFRAAAVRMVRSPEEICACMHAADAPTRYSKLNYPVDAKTARWALKNCHLMRNRFTLIDLLYYTGRWNEDFIGRILSRAESLDAGL